MKARSKLRIGDLLVQKGYLEPRQLKAALNYQKKTKDPLGQICVRLGFLTADQFNETLEEQLSGDVEEVAEVEAPTEFKIAAGSRKQLGELLVESENLKPDQLKLALRDQEQTGELLGQICVRLGFTTQQAVNAALAEQTGLPTVDLDSIEIPSSVLELIPAPVARKYRVLPIHLEGLELQVAVDPFLNVPTIDLLREGTGYAIEPVIVDPEQLRSALDYYYKDEEALEDLVARALETLQTETEQTERLPLTNLLNLLIRKAVRSRATDLHFEVEEELTRVRQRIDGTMRIVTTLPGDLQEGLVTRLKVLANLDISETRIPQDGQVQFHLDGERIDCRLSTYPTIHGETAVLRLMTERVLIGNLPSLGMEGEVLELFKELLERPLGLLVVCGPTGSGKTTTLYAALHRLSSTERTIVTVEDPVEYRIPLLKQSQVNPKAGFTFAKALPHVLRHDPDVILIGEIRDEETASLGYQAAMTGHLVLTTVHANSAADAVLRFNHLGVDAPTIANSSVGFCSQRLVRKICPSCAAKGILGQEVRKNLDERVVMELQQGEYKTGAGCADCDYTGFRGRTGIFEVLPMSRQLENLILAGATGSEIEEKVPYPKLFDDGILKAKQGVTTIEEILRHVA